jgi:hypothetical protein
MDSDYDNSSSTTTDGKLTTAQAQALADKFDLIYPVETKLLGYEYGGAPGSAEPGGKDGDIKVQILVYDFGGGGAAGFFWSKDFYIMTGSNLAEMFYVDVGQVERSPDYTYSLLVHEFQHMINFNVKYVENHVSSAAWYDETLSTMAEDVISPLIGVGPTNWSHPINQRISTFLNNYDSLGVTEWSTLDSVAYAKGFAFGAYLVRNYGGAQLLQKILANNTTNVASISAALNELNPGLDFYKALESYGEAFIYSGANRPEGVLSFDNTISKTVSGTVYTHTGFDIWSRWGGPRIFDVTQTEMRPASVLVQSSDDWRNKTGSFSITLDKPASEDVVLYLMVK